MWIQVKHELQKWWIRPPLWLISLFVGVQCEQQPPEDTKNLRYWSYAMLLGENTEYLYQDEITFECDLGFHIPWLDQSESSLHSTCQANGQWSHEMPSSCTSVLCPLFPEQPHTLFRVRKSGRNYRQSLIEFTDQVTFYCDEGFEIGDRQNVTVTCTANGGYDIELPPNLCQRESLTD